jgi:tight adherence protein B
MVEGLAAASERRAESIADSEAHGSGAKLSARLIAGLPLAFLPVTPMTRAPMTDRPGILLLVCGVGLALAGVSWISALFPKPDPHDDAAAVIAEVMACAVEGGADVRSALLEICSHPPPGVTKEVRLRRLVDLGVPSSEALERSGDESLATLGRSLAAATAMGLPVAPVLRDFASLRRSDKEREFEAAVRRAPVRMAIPLAVCVLPSFVVLGIGPFLRGLSFGA